MKMTSAYANKVLKRLNEDKEFWMNKERTSYLYKATADEEPVIPEYDYSDVAANIAEIDDAASVMHMMNANTFTGAAYHVTDAANVETLAATIKDNILARQWMCGFPDKMIVVQVGDDYLVTAFGNGEIMDNFLSKLQAEYSGAKVLFEEVIR